MSAEKKGLLSQRQDGVPVKERPALRGDDYFKAMSANAFFG